MPIKIHTNYLSPKCEARTRPEKGGYGVFAHTKIAAGELVAVFGGDVVSGDDLKQLPEAAQIHSIQVEENLYLVSNRELEPADYFNHCCEPNVGLNGQIAVVAMRDIEPDEEVCFDYAMCDGSPYDEFQCACGVPACRRRVSGDDWRHSELWERYAGYFSPYLQRRIDKLRRTLG
jgi:uncharacterized protein